MRLTFEGIAADLDKGQTPLAESGLSEAEAALAIEEVKIGCTLAMLVCLTGDLRMAYVLGDVLELTDTEAAPVLENFTGGISPAAQACARSGDRLYARKLRHCLSRVRYQGGAGGRA